MEFRFNVNEIFKTPIVEIGSNLVPPGFQGDRRQLWEAVTKVSEIINTIGEASASAQGLTKPITTSERLRNAENQRLYLLIDKNTKTGKGCVTGMLKTGKKGLYVFDRVGQHYQVQPNCILDFYIHESRQRTGLGKHLFEHMLQKEEVDPVKLAIDRPSDKFLAFLKKHYNLDAAIRQMNNYVVFEGFFPEEEKLMSQQHHHQSANNNTDTPTNRMTTTIHLDKRGSNGLQQQAITSPYGRYGAPRPKCSMGQIIHNQSAVVGPQEPAGCSLNIKPSKDRSAFTLRRGSRHAGDEEMRRQYYAPPRLPFNPCPAVGNGLEYATAPDSSPSLQESNIQLVTKDQMMRVAFEQQQKQPKLNRPQSILQNLPSPTLSKHICHSSSSVMPNINPATFVQQNVKVFDGSNPNLIRSPSGMRCYQVPDNNLRPCNMHSHMVVGNQPARVQPSDTRILRPKPLITDPMKDYSKSPTACGVDPQQQNMQYVHQPIQQQYAQQVSNYQQQPDDSEDSPRTFHWQNQIYQSRDAPTNYPFVCDQRNPNRNYVSHEESGGYIKQQQEAASPVEVLPNQQHQQQQQQQQVDAITPATFELVDQIPKRSKNTEQKVFPQRNVQPHQLVSPPSEGQTYQLNSQNINPPNSSAYQLQQQQVEMNQQQHAFSSANLYQPLPTIREIDSEQAISSKRESIPMIAEDYGHRPPQQTISKFTVNQNTDRRPLQEISPRSNENVRSEQYYGAPSPRYNQNNVCSAVTSQNVGNLDAQGPRLNQYLVQQHQKIDAEYNPPRQENAHMRPLSSHPAVMQNVGNIEQQIPRLNLSLPAVAQEYSYPPPPTVESRQEIHYQKPSPRSSNGLIPAQEQQRQLTNEPLNTSPSPRHFPYASNNLVHKSPINHLEYDFTPTATQPETTFERTMQVPPNDKSEQVKPNCLPERTPRLNSDQASASTQINIPKNVVGPVAQPISPGYNNLETERYKNLTNSQSAVSGQGRWENSNAYQQQQRDARYDVTPKPDKSHVPNMKGDMVANSLSGSQLQQRPAEIRPEITSQ